jgi:hypothetical protein
LEFCAEADILRGGDGNILACGGWGAFAVWAPLASAFYLKRTNSEQVLHGLYLRRTYPLDRYLE